ncbi:tRNA lysidine(34) synthetase TilS [Sphingomonas lutea]|uniref:tRNA(Ile)-lysidine synthase n=1 Tax=Sphingomonas lutea TaxID=1045317 RepID=A0A7G9SJL4_9SPHN|nr:tRNA lysidine(34) synthetase TilS [Sphingomonas lutea]QNN68039.1 tRNA lysidine(34) synthetase TilS [Sphingomonas lutea]
MPIAPDIASRFTRDLDALCPQAARIGIAVSGGADSLALLLLAASVRSGQVEAATVDHALRPESRGEAKMVSTVCAELGVPHRVLTAQWDTTPQSALQERARHERYRLLGLWGAERGLDAILAAHHLDDQAETFLMRLVRGAGVRGLAGIRPSATIPGGNLPLLRPLIGWRRNELEEICNQAGLSPAIDPGNADQTFERVRVRGALADADWLDSAAIAASAQHLADADRALEWAVDRAWPADVDESDGGFSYRPGNAPKEVRRRVTERIVRRLASEGGSSLRGAELDHLLNTLARGDQATLRGVLCKGGDIWRFVSAPHRTRRGEDSR